MIDAEFSLHGFDLFGNRHEPAAACKLADDFIVPPFSILNAREGAWQERKRKWIALGIQSELGRGDNSLSLSRECESYRNRKHGYE